MRKSIIIMVLLTLYMCSQSLAARYIPQRTYGDWVQYLETPAGKVKVTFIKVFDTWSSKKTINYYEFKEKRNEYAFKFRLVDDLSIVYMRTPFGKCAIMPIHMWSSMTDKKLVNGKWVRKDNYTYNKCGYVIKPGITSLKNKNFWESIDPNMFPLYHPIAPKMEELFYKSTTSYKNIKIDVSGDTPFNKDKVISEFLRIRSKDKIRSSLAVPPEQLKFLVTDDDNNGIIDSYQVNFAKTLRLPDANNDMVNDVHQTIYYYIQNGKSNYIDLDGDNISDTYMHGVLDPKTLIATIPYLKLDLSEDIFQNKNTARVKNRRYVDINKDGINDAFQDTQFAEQLYNHMLNYYSSYGKDVEKRFTIFGVPKGKYNFLYHFSDKNGDTINDLYQTLEGYYKLGLTNFVDSDGDGLCDNYIK